MTDFHSERLDAAEESTEDTTVQVSAATTARELRTYRAALTERPWLARDDPPFGGLERLLDRLIRSAELAVHRRGFDAVFPETPLQSATPEAIRRHAARHDVFVRNYGPAVIDKAHALVTRTWLPFARYVNSATLAYHDWPDMAVEGANATGSIVQALRDQVEDLALPAAQISLGGELLSLPREADDPGGMQAHPTVLDLVIALTACLPAVFLALLDDAVPEELGSGEAYAARAALAELHARYAVTDPAYCGAERALVERVLLRAPLRTAPIEVTDRWRWLVYVDDDDGIPFRCFRELRDAQRYAVLQTDYSRSIMDKPRSSAEFRAALQAIAACPPDGIIVPNPGTGYATVLAPNPPRPLPVRLASPSW